uniref:Major intrinsically disordered NOTCH2-binding receptor 1-like n=1 Tax=Pogona vitticeps TaxID=103695 RepID=A0ABM5FCS7_9SAUR
MDLSALPNNNHPDKFLQLDVKSLAKTSVFLQTWLANFPEEHFPGEQQWHNRVYSQVSGLITRLASLLIQLSGKPPPDHLTAHSTRALSTLVVFHAAPRFQTFAILLPGPHRRPSSGTISLMSGFGASDSESSSSSSSSDTNSFEDDSSSATVPAPGDRGCTRDRPLHSSLVPKSTKLDSQPAPVADKPTSQQAYVARHTYARHRYFMSAVTDPFQEKEKKNAREEPVVQPSALHPAMIDKALGKHITPVTLKSTIKSNPLYSDVFTDTSWQERKNNPSWTVQDYDRHSLNSSLADYLKENPNEIQYWLEDIYTPGYDTLLKKKERERKLSRCCLIMLLLVLLVCIVAATVTVCILLA